MDKAKILVVKFVPDIFTMEPNNIGVIIWTPNEIKCKFIESQSHVMLQWIDYWTIMTSNDYLRDSECKVIPRNAPEYVEALCKKSKASCMLVDIGDFSIKSDFDINEVTTFMFKYLIEAFTRHSEKS